MKFIRIKFLLLIFVKLTLMLKIKSNKNDLKCLINDEEIKEMNIHVIPHSHQDPGWIYSFEDYYSGNNYQAQSVRAIYDSLIEYLDSNEEKTFVISEISFFEKWYKQCSKFKQEKFKKLLKSKRIEFVNGGWVMNDEATTNYDNILTQFRLGRKFLKEEFGINKITNAWFLDTFGHSNSNAYLLNKLGFENLVMVRIDYREKEIRKRTNNLEFNWNSYGDINKASNSIFTHITSNHYSPSMDNELFKQLLSSPKQNESNNNYFYYLNSIVRKNFDAKKFDENYSFDEKILDQTEFELLDTTNSIKEKINEIYLYLKGISNGYKSKELLFLYGDDFTYQNSKFTFFNMDTIIKEFKSNLCFKDKINIFYSTPEKYFDKIKSSNIEFPTLVGTDFFPYSDQEGDYWTGFYTSRPAFKGFINESNFWANLVTEFKFFEYLKTNIFNVNTADLLYEFNKSISIAQHHDAITGTERDEVSDNYFKNINDKFLPLKNLLSSIFLYEGQKIEDIKLCRKKIIYDEECNNIIISTLDRNQTSSEFSLINYKLVDLNMLVEIKMDLDTKIDKILYNEKEIKYEISCYNELIECTISFNFIFKKTQLKYDFKIIQLEEKKDVKLNKTEKTDPIKIESNIKPNDKELREENIFEFKKNKNSLKFDRSNNKITIETESTKIDLEIFHAFYKYYLFKDSYENRNGAYLFASNSNDYEKAEFVNSEILSIKDNLNKNKISHIVISIRFTTSLIKIKFNTDNLELFELENIILPFETQTSISSNNLILVINSNINNLEKDKVVFYTDSNGLRKMKRKFDFRDNFNFIDAIKNEKSFIERNFYPMTSYATINDLSNKLVVFGDRSQGVTSHKKGELIFMISRFSFNDDRKGLSRGLYEAKSNDSYGFKTNHFISFNSKFNELNLIKEINKKDYLIIYYDFDIPKINQVVDFQEEFFKFKNLIEDLMIDCYTYKYLTIKNEFFIQLLSTKNLNSNRFCKIDLLFKKLTEINKNLVIEEYELNSINKTKSTNVEGPFNFRLFKMFIK